MYVCVCNAVTEGQIYEAVENGASTVKQLKETLNVGSDCASCVGCAKACIQSAKRGQKSKHQMQTTMAGQVIPSVSPISLGVR